MIGFDSSRILIVRGGMFMSLGSFPESLNQGILVGIILAGRLGVGKWRRGGRKREGGPTSSTENVRKCRGSAAEKCEHLHEEFTGLAETRLAQNTLKYI